MAADVVGRLSMKRTCVDTTESKVKFLIAIDHVVGMKPTRTSNK
jgi:hypothetical protein